MVRQLWMLLAVLWWASPALAARVDLSVATRELVEGQVVALTLDVIDGKPDGVPQISAPPGLEVHYQSQSQQTTSVNFKVSRMVRFQYQLKAVAEGEYTLGPVPVQVAGQPLASRVVRLTVGPRPETPDRPYVADLAFLPEEAWVGQVVVLRYRLRARVEVLESQWTLPELDGLVAPREGDRPRSRYALEDELGPMAVDESFIPLVASQRGDLGLDGAMVRISLADRAKGRGRDPFDPFRMMTPSRTESLVTDSAPLAVRALPPAPAGFTGLVGDFEFAAQADKTQVSVGDSVNWVVTVQGDGTLEGFELPPLEAVDGARVYQSSPRTGAQVRDGRYQAAGELTQVIVPTAEGTLAFPPLELITFSPTQGRYLTHRVEVPPIEVQAGAEGEAAVESFGAAPGQAAGPEVRDIAGEKLVGPAFAVALDPYLGWLVALAAAPGLGLLGLTGWERLRERRRALEVAPGPSQRIARLPEDPLERAALLEGALREALAVRGGGSAASLDRRAAAAGLDEPLRGQVESALRALDRVRYGGAELGADEVEQARQAVRGLEGR
ncbi:MAG: BatD family protein [Deltaproteobacteria bacterium]|nr:BatD family protein [Deltaproteobacteria bacterium]